MEVSGARDARRAGAARARFWTGAQVAFASLLCGSLVLLLGWLAERPGLRLRIDLTRDRQNTLAESSLAVIAKLPEEATIDVFFRPGDPPFREIAFDVQTRVKHLLLLARDAAPGRIQIEEHDLSDRRGTATRAETRMRELGVREIEPGGLVVVACGRRTQVLRLRGDLADLDPGDPQGRFGPPRPARLVAFRGEEALLSALLKVAQSESAKVVFTVGHGELDLAEADIGGLALLKQNLERDGFVVTTWDGARAAAIDADALVLASIGAEQPFTAAERAEIERFVGSGGRFVAAPGYVPRDGEHTLSEILKGYGVTLVAEGVVARPVATATGQLYVGRSECSEIVVSRALMAVHPVTDPLRRGDRRIVLPLARALQRGRVPPGGTLLDLVRSPDEAWRDVPAGSIHDWTPGPDEARGPFVLAMAAIFPPSQPLAEPRARELGARPETRLVCVGSASAFANETFATNRDFVLNAFNWAAAREFRVGARARDPQARRIDVTSGRALATVTLVSAVMLPVLCLSLGLWTAWRRKAR